MGSKIVNTAYDYAHISSPCMTSERNHGSNLHSTRTTRLVSCRILRTPLRVQVLRVPADRAHDRNAGATPSGLTRNSSRHPRNCEIHLSATEILGKQCRTKNSFPQPRPASDRFVRT